MTRRFTFLQKTGSAWRNSVYEVMAPDYETVLPLLDKSRTLKLAAEAGFPHPQTYRIDEHDLADLAQRIEPPRGWCGRPSRHAAVAWK